MATAPANWRASDIPPRFAALRAASSCSIALVAVPASARAWMSPALRVAMAGCEGGTKHAAARMAPSGRARTLADRPARREPEFLRDGTKFEVMKAHEVRYRTRRVNEPSAPGPRFTE